MGEVPDTMEEGGKKYQNFLIQFSILRVRLTWHQTWYHVTKVSCIVHTYLAQSLEVGGFGCSICFHSTGENI